MRLCVCVSMCVVFSQIKRVVWKLNKKTTRLFESIVCSECFARIAHVWCYATEPLKTEINGFTCSEKRRCCAFRPPRRLLMCGLSWRIVLFFSTSSCVYSLQQTRSRRTKASILIIWRPRNWSGIVRCAATRLDDSVPIAENQLETSFIYSGKLRVRSRRSGFLAKQLIITSARREYPPATWNRYGCNVEPDLEEINRELWQNALSNWLGWMNELRLKMCGDNYQYNNKWYNE